MKKLTILAIAFATTISTIAQITDLETQVRDKSSIVAPTPTDSTAKPKRWFFNGLTALNISQASFVNWAAGGENSIGGNALVNLNLSYKGDNSSWDTRLELGYGILQQGKKGMIKTDDKIDFSSKYGHKASKHWYYAAMINFKTQFDQGFETEDDAQKRQNYISNFLAPAYLVGAIGMDYKPFDCLSLFISPVTGKFTFVEDKHLRSRYSLEEDQLCKSDLGGYIRVLYNQSFFKDNMLTITSKLDLFCNYLAEHPENIDVTWENVFAIKITKYISATLSTELIYDDDIKTIEKLEDGTEITRGAKIQFKEVLGIGLAYKF